jgi:signal transduction histidine kinase
MGKKNTKLPGINATKAKSKSAIITVIVAFVSINVGVLFLITYFNSRFQQSKAQIVEQLSLKKSLLENRFNQIMHIPDALNAFVSINHKVDSSYFQKLAQRMNTQVPIFINISVAPNNIITQVFPLKGNESVIGFNYMEHPQQKYAVLRAMETKKTSITGPVDLMQGGRAFIFRSPIFTTSTHSTNSTYWGMVSLVVDSEKLMSTLKSTYDSGILPIAVRFKENNKKAVFYGDSTIFSENALIMPLTLPGNETMEIASQLLHPWEQKNIHFYWPIFTALFIILLITYSIYYSTLNYYRLKGLYLEKSKLAEELKELTDQKNKLYNIIAHDIRAPFNTLASSIQILSNQEDYTENEKQNIFKNLKINSDALNNLLGNLLHWTKAQIEQQNFNPKYNDASQIIHDTVNVIQSLASYKNIDIEQNIELDEFIYCEKVMIETVLRNLLSNAIKFSNHDNTIVLNVFKRANMAVFEVLDTGIGLSKEKLEKIFRNVKLESEPGTDNEKGTGLGLMISKEFVEKHGGEIWAESNPGIETKFAFTIPL